MFACYSAAEAVADVLTIVAIFVAAVLIALCVGSYFERRS